MARVTVSREVTQTNLLKKANPTTVTQVTAETVSMLWTNANSELQLAFALDFFPSAYQFKQLIGARLAVTATPASRFAPNLFNSWGLRNYSASELNWANRPVDPQDGEQSWQKSAAAAETFYVGDQSDSLPALRLSRTRGVLLSCVYPDRWYGTGTGPLVEFYTHAASNPAYRPRVEFLVDDAVDVTSQIVLVSGPVGGHVDRTAATSFSWKYEAANGLRCMGTFTQSSAKIYWKLSTASQWNLGHSESGTYTSATIPANTFPGGTIQWYIEGKTVDGTTTQTPVYSFSTTDAPTYAYPVSPADEVRDGSAPITFQFRTENQYGSGAQRTGLVYSTDGTNWSSLGAVNGPGLSYTAPANTFPAGTIYWKCRSNNLDGSTSPYSDPVSFICVAAPAAPTVSATSVPFSTVRWSASGQQAYRISIKSAAPVIIMHPQSGAYSAGNTTYLPIKAAGSGLSYQWQYRANASSAWTDSHGTGWNTATLRADVTAAMNGYEYRCVVTNSYGSATTKAAKITVKSTGQPAMPAIAAPDAYAEPAFPAEGITYGPMFGTEKTFALPDYLPDGTYIISVEVQGQYGLWSAPGTFVVSIANQPGSVLTLSGSFGVDAELCWGTSESTKDFYLYRDGVRIAHTRQQYFVDRLAMGDHMWQVINRLSSGNYTMSNFVGGAPEVSGVFVAPTSGGAWISLRLTELSAGEQSFGDSRSHSLRHIAGAKLPVLELAPYIDGSGSYLTAFADKAAAAAFEALRGQTVIVKSRGGNVVVGALTQIDKRVGDFFVSFSFTLQRIHWEDYVDDTGG